MTPLLREMGKTSLGLGLQTAGFVIDPHACYYAGVVINNRALPHKCLSASVDAAWPGLLRTQPFPTAMAALLANMKRGYNTVLVRKGTPTDTPKCAETATIPMHDGYLYLPTN